jgi:hydrogenase maturation factor HypF (carbamoyltransferase family)
VTASRLHDSSGRIIGAIESVRDISAQKRMEIELAAKLKELEYQHEELHQQETEPMKQNEELLRVFNLLKESEEKYRIITESINDGIVAMDLQIGSRSSTVGRSRSPASRAEMSWAGACRRPSTTRAVRG